MITGWLLVLAIVAIIALIFLDGAAKLRGDNDN